jgi:hypothetical protein
MRLPLATTRSCQAVKTPTTPISAKPWCLAAKRLIECRAIPQGGQNQLTETHWRKPARIGGRVRD